MNKVTLILTPRIFQLNKTAIAGTERVFIEDAKFLKNHGFNVKAFARFRYAGVKNIQYSNVFESLYRYFISSRYRFVSVIGNFFRICGDFFYSFSLLRLIQDDETIFSHGFPLFALFYPERTFIVLGAIWDLDYKNIFLNRYKKASYIFCSKNLQSEFNKLYPCLQRSNQIVIYNAIDTTKFGPLNYSNKNKRDTIKLLYASAWIPEKGLLELLESIKMLSSGFIKKVELTVLNCKNLWLSDLTSNNQSYIAKIESLISSFPNVRLLDGKPYEQMKLVYNTHDILVMPSMWPEPFGLVVLEAITCGLPVLAYKTGALPEILDESNSYFVSVKNPIALKSAIIKIVNNEIRFEKSGKSLLTKKNSNMTYEARINAFSKLMDDLKSL